MSGICAAWQKQSGDSAGSILAAINRGLALARTDSTLQENDSVGGVAVCGHSAREIHGSERLFLACDTDLINAAELAQEAGLAGERARPAAVLAAMYERRGEAFVERLRGAFSVVIWDRRERRLIAATDGFGIKRLAWYEDENGVLIGSRVDALARSLGRDLEIEPAAIANVLNFSSNLAPLTIFKKIRRLIPGSLLVVSDGRVRCEKYWSMRYYSGGRSSEEKLSSELERVVQSSVSAHIAGCPKDQVGAFLSGGTDSSTVLGMMSRAAQPPVKSFSIGFDEERFNEMEYAELAARHFHSRHYTYNVTASDCFDALPKMVTAFDEPFGNSSAIPTYFCAKLAAEQGVRILLAGDGGDELFGGNERYATDKIFQVYHSLPAFVRKGVIEPAAAVLPGGLWPVRRARNYLRRANMPGAERMFSFQFLRTHTLQEVFTPDFVSALGQYTILDIPADHYSRAAARDHLDRLLYVDVNITLGDNDLPKVTSMSELAGIQTRFPFLDRSVAEFSGRIPARLKVKGFNKRYLFKRAFRNLLPPEIIKKKKHGFGIPVASWMKSDKRMRELSHDTLLSNRTLERGYFKKAFIEKFFQENEATDDPYYGDILWTVLVLELWQREMAARPIQVTA